MSTFFGRNWRIIVLSTCLMVGILATTVIGRANPTRQQVDMRSYIGKYNFDSVDGYILLENPMVLDAFTQANVPESVGRDIRGYEVSGPIEDQQGILISQGCLQHFCSEFHYKLYVNLESNSVALCHFARQSTWYVSQGVASAPSTAPCPSEFSSAPSSIRAALGQGNMPTTAADPGSGRIWGAFSYPSDYMPADIEACAENVVSGAVTCARRSTTQGRTVFYSLDVRPGRYRVYAHTSDMPDKKAYYSQSIICGNGAGGNSRCTDHMPVVLEVTSGSVHPSVNPQDWYAPAQMQSGGTLQESGATATQQSSYAANIVGGWVPSGESCEGDGGIIYLADGTWSALSADGTWTVRENLLAMRTLHQGEPGEGMQSLRPPRIDINTIVNLTGSLMTQRFGDGSTVYFTRC